MADKVLALVHRDGHVAAMSNGDSEPVEAKLRGLHDLMRRAGIQGWRLRELDLAEAIRAHVTGLHCQTCAVVLPCGCSIARTLARQCPHGSADRLHRLAHLTGYCSNDNPQHRGPPLEEAGA